MFEGRSHRTIPIRRLLGGLIVGVAAPLLALAIALLWRVSDAERRVIEANRFDRVTSLSHLMDGEIGAIKLFAENFARAPDMQKEDFTGLHEFAQSVVGDRIAIIAVISRSGQQVMSTVFAASDPLPVSRNMAFLKKVFEGQSAVSDILIGTASKRPIVSVSVPVVIGGEVKYALSVVINSEQFTSLFREAGISPNWTAAIVDSGGLFVARNLDADRMVGSPARPELGVAARGPDDHGTFANVTLEGVSTESTFRRSQVTGWTAVVAVPTDILYAAYRTSLLWALAFASAAAFLIYLSVVKVGGRLADEIRQVGAAATDLVSGKPMHFNASYVWELQEVQEAYRLAATSALQKQESDARIRFLVKELSHRTKNLLTVVQAVSRSTIRSAQSFEEYNDKFGGRLTSLAATQDLLFAHPSGDTALDALIRLQLASFPVDAIHVTNECTRFQVHPDLVQPLGMAFYELATNSIKYGSLSVPSGEVEISCTPAAGGMTICWREVGGPPVAPPSRKGFGSYVLRDYVASSIKGSVDIQYEGGLRWSLMVPNSHLVRPSAKIHSPDEKVVMW